MKPQKRLISSINYQGAIQRPRHSWIMLNIILIMLMLACSSLSSRPPSEVVIRLPTLTPTVEGQNLRPTLPAPTPEPVSSSPSDLPTPSAPPVVEPTPGAQNGVIAKLALRDNKSVYAVGEKVFVKVEATNIEGGVKPIGILGLIPDSGDFQTIGDNSQIEAGKPVTYEDDLVFSTPGQHKLWLSICFSSKAECQGANGDWVRFEPGLDLIVQ